MTILPMTKKPTKAERIERLKAFGFKFFPIRRIYGVEVRGLDQSAIVKIKTLADQLVGLSPSGMKLKHAREAAVYRVLTAVEGFVQDCERATAPPVMLTITMPIPKKGDK
jgi:hypothetical protein